MKHVLIAIACIAVVALIVPVGGFDTFSPSKAAQLDVDNADLAFYTEVRPFADRLASGWSRVAVVRNVETLNECTDCTFDGGSRDPPTGHASRVNDDPLRRLTHAPKQRMDHAALPRGQLIRSRHRRNLLSYALGGFFT